MYVLSVFCLLALACFLIASSLHCSMQDLNSLTMDQTRAPGTGSAESQPLNYQGSLSVVFVCLSRIHQELPSALGFCRAAAGVKGAEPLLGSRRWANLWTPQAIFLLWDRVF